MNIKELVETLQKFIVNPRQNEPAWKALVGTEPSLLRRSLQDLVSGTEALTEAVLVLYPCWVVLQGRDFPAAIRTFYDDKRQGFVNADRLCRNVKALIATAMAAAAADRFLKGEKGAAALLTSWAGRAADLLSSRAEVQPVILPVRAAVSDAATLVHGAFDKLATQSRGGVAARYWSLCWLGSEKEKDLETGRLTIPVAAANRTGRGFIGDLILNRLTDDSAAELVEHPDNALLALGDSLLAGMLRAWESAPARQSACWRLKFGSGAQDGDSLSGAAAVGFNNLFTDRRFIPTCLIIGRLDADMKRLLPAGGYQEKLSEAQKENIRIAVLAEDPETPISPRLQNLQIKRVLTLDEAVQHASGLPGQGQLLDGRYVCERPLHSDSLDRWIGRDTQDETSQLIKTWELERLEKNFRRALWDNELRTMYKVSSSPRAKEFLVVMKDAGIDHDVGQFVMVMDAPEYDTLDSALARRSENPWLQAGNLRVPGERRKVWEALLRIARGIGLLHRQRVIHRNITAENVFLSITPEGRFDTWRLGGFEWSVRFGELVPKGPHAEWAVPPEHGESGATEVSFEADWYGFGMLVARCFYAIESLSSQPARILNDLLMERLATPEPLTPKEVNLIHRLVDPEPASRLHYGPDILNNLREIIHALADTALSENRDNPLVLVLDLNKAEFAEKAEAAGFKPPPGEDKENPKLQYDKYDSEHKVRLKEFLVEDLQEGQIYYIEDSSRYLLAGKHLVIALSPFRDDRRGIKPNWDIAYADYTTALIGGTPIANLKAAKLAVRFRNEITTNTRTRNWQPFLPREEQRSAESSALETFREFLRCTNQLELMMCCAEIFPYRLTEKLDAGLATERIRIEPRPGKQELEVFQRDGMIEFMRRQAASRVGEDRVYLSDEDTVNLGHRTDVEAWKVEKTEDSYLILSRATDSAPQGSHRSPGRTLLPITGFGKARRCPGGYQTARSAV
jgi:serine/threonine protein kinase